MALRLAVVVSEVRGLGVRCSALNRWDGGPR